MNISIIKRLFLSLTIVAIVSGSVYAWSGLTASDGDTLTHTKWNEMVDTLWLWKKDGSNIAYTGGSVGIGAIVTDARQKLRIDGGWSAFGDSSLTGSWLNLEAQNGFHRMAFNQLRFYDWDDASDIVTFNNNGVGIGINPSHPLHIDTGADNSTLGMYVRGRGYFTGDLFVYNAWLNSDERLKTNIAPIESALSTVTQLDGVSFDWKDSGKSSFGLIAQELEGVVPELVYTKEDGYKAVDYQKLSAFFIEAIKDQQNQIEDLKQRIESLEK